MDPKRLTLNYGLRFDSFNGHAPAQHAPAGRFTPARDFEPVDDVPSWTDLNPRRRRWYDLFGDGRTAVKVSLGRFVESRAASLTTANNPIATSVTTVNRTWNDVNRNYVPDCNLTNFSTNGECGPVSDQLRRTRAPRAMPTSVLHGFGVATTSGTSRRKCSTSSVRHVGDRRLLPRLVRQLSRHRQLTVTPPTSARTASRRRSIRGCRAAAGIRSADSTTSPSRSSARSTTW